MASRYNGLCDAERMAVVALRVQMELQGVREKFATPESELRELINSAKLSGQGVLDERKILSAFYGRR